MTSLLPVTRNNRWWPARTSWIDRFFDDLPIARTFEDREEWIPAFDLSENEREFTVTAELPGLKAEDVDISLDKGLLTVRGEKKHEDEREEGGYHLVERRYGSFSRSFRLPVEVKDKEVKADYRDGVLKITLPKSEEGGANRIPVNAG
ncbi:MAG: Hsp20/alpha crystallin family protein [Desulfatibacillaceae bacterium]